MVDSIRQPAVAGSFYPADKDQLEKILDSLFKKAKSFVVDQKPRILIVPHAGIIYSGKVAASGFSLLKGKSYQRVILLGASHHYFFEKAAIDDSSFWKTPLGQVPLDKNLIQFLIKDSKNISLNSLVHQPEHDLEVELIFLQKILSSFKIIPILVSQPTKETIEELVKKIEERFDHQTLLVISTDLSHYPKGEIAELVDKQTIKAILNGDPLFFEKKVREIEEKYTSEIETAICGFSAVKVGLTFGKLLGIEKYQLIDYQHSGEVSGDNSSVVGYGVIVGFKKNLSSTLKILDEDEKRQALMIAKVAIESQLSGKNFQLSITNNHLKKKGYGVFVTLKIKGQLRGCIGRIEGDEPLEILIKKMALESAFSDPRFPPLTSSELKDLEIEITILSPLKKVNSYQEVRLGKDGVMIERGWQRAVFLPQVAEETDWDLERFLSALCQKGGMEENCYFDKETKIFVFQTQVI